MTQTLLLVTVGAAIRSSDVVKAGGSNGCPNRSLGASPLCKQSSPDLLAQFSSIHFPLQGWVFGRRVVLERISSSTPGVGDSATAALSSEITGNLVTKSSVLSLLTGAGGGKKNLASASLRNASAVKLGNLMS